MAQVLTRIRQVAGLDVPGTRAWLRGLAIPIFAALTAAAAYAAVPVPGTAVPITLQTLVVILAGALLGPRLGAASQVTYLAAGAAGLPVFSGGGAGLLWLLGPTGGYLIAFPAAAFLVGVLAPDAARLAAGGFRATSGFAALVAEGRLLGRLAFALLAGVALILAAGAAHLAVVTGDSAAALRLGVLPFIVGEVYKVGLALVIARQVRSRTLGLL